jgi:hypothetical protein
MTPGVSMKTFAPLALAFLFAAFPAVQASADWPQFRGVNRDAQSAEKGLLQQWPAGGPRLAWQVSGLGGGYSSVSIQNGRLFTMGDIGADQFVIALVARYQGDPLEDEDRAGVDRGPLRGPKRHTHRGRRARLRDRYRGRSDGHRGRHRQGPLAEEPARATSAATSCPAGSGPSRRLSMATVWS